MKEKKRKGGEMMGDWRKKRRGEEADIYSTDHNKPTFISYICSFRVEMKEKMRRKGIGGWQEKSRDGRETERDI